MLLPLNLANRLTHIDAHTRTGLALATHLPDSVPLFSGSKLSVGWTDGQMTPGGPSLFLCLSLMVTHACTYTHTPRLTPAPLRTQICVYNTPSYCLLYHSSEASLPCGVILEYVNVSSLCLALSEQTSDTVC